MSERSPFVRDLLGRVDLIKLVSEFCPLEQQSRGLWVGWHNVHESESKKSLVVFVNHDPQDWVCYGCVNSGYTSHRGGTAIDFLLSMGRCQTPGEAIVWLCDKCGIKRPNWTPEQQAEWEHRRNERQIVEAVLMEAAEYYHRQLTPERRAYYHSRGLVDESIDKFKLGYADGTLYHALTKGVLLNADGTRKHNNKELLLSGLFVQFKDGTIKDAFEQRYTLPYWLRGKVVYLIGRIEKEYEAGVKKQVEPLKEELTAKKANPEADKSRIERLEGKIKSLSWNLAKYRKLPTWDEKERPYISQEVQNETFYGEDSLYEHTDGIVTEGVVDCLLALQAGFSCISPVTIGFRKEDLTKLAKLTERWETVYIINDNEESGRGEVGALGTAEYLLKQGRDVRLVELPRPEGVSKVDLADFLNVQEGQSEFKNQINPLRELMDNAPDFIEWKIREAKGLPERKRPKAVTKIAQLIHDIDDSERDRYIEKMVLEGLSKRQTIKEIIKQAKISKAKAAKAERMKEAEETLSPSAFLRMQIEEIRKGWRKSFQIKRAVSDSIQGDMKERGKFYQTATRDPYWFDREEKELYLIGDDWLGVHINHRYGINQSESESDFLIHDLRTLAVVRGEKIEVYQFAFYDQQAHVLYIYNNAHQIYRLNGESVDLVDNGTDGILFLGNPLHEPFTYKPGVTDKIWPILVDPLSFAQGGEVNLTPDEQKQMFLIWIYTLFFESLQPTKPLQFFLGEKGSGKTTAQRRIGRTLFGKHFDLTSVKEDGQKDAIAAVTNNYFVGFDNVDAKISWLPDFLAQMATGKRIQMRELYTTNTERIYFPKCFLSLNAREPKFKRDDVVDRLLLFRVERLKKFRPEAEILNEIGANRDALWSELIDDLNQIVAFLKTDQEKFTSPFRMADWAELGWRIAKINGKGSEFVRLLEKMDQAQSEFLLEDNTIKECLDEWILNANNVGREVKAKDLFGDFKAIAEANQISFGYQSARSLGMQLRHIISNLRNYFEIGEEQHKRHGWIYTFRPKGES